MAANASLSIWKIGALLLTGYFLVEITISNKSAGTSATEPKPLQVEMSGDVDKSKGEDTRSWLLIDDSVMIIKPYLACKVIADLDRVKELAMLKSDTKAAVAYGFSHDCELQAVGSKFKVEDLSALHGAACIRREGEPDCVWFPRQLIERQKARTNLDPSSK